MKNNSAKSRAANTAARKASGRENTILRAALSLEIIITDASSAALAEKYGFSARKVSKLRKKIFNGDEKLAARARLEAPIKCEQNSCAPLKWK